MMLHLSISCAYHMFKHGSLVFFIDNVEIFAAVAVNKILPNGGPKVSVASQSLPTYR